MVINRKFIQNEITGKKSPSFLKTLRIVGGVLFVICCIYIYYFQIWFGSNPFKGIEFEDVVDAVRLENGEVIVALNSGDTLIKLSEEEEIIWIANGEDYGFSGISKITVGGDDRIYLYEVEYENGIRIANEKIVSMTQNGTEPKEIYSSEAPKGTMRQSVVGFTPTNDGILFMLTEKDGIGLYDSNTGKVKLYRMKDSDQNVIYTAINQENGDLFYDTYSGYSYKYVDGKNDELIFSADMEDASVPQNICFKDGNLYIADVGRRFIIKKDVETGSKTILKSEENYDDREMDAVVNIDAGGLCSVSEYSVTLWNETEGKVLYDAPYSMHLKLRGILFNLAFIIALLVLTFEIARFLNYIFTQKSDNLRVIVGIILGVVGLGTLFLGSLFPNFQEQFMDELYRKEELAASVAITKVPTDAVTNITKVSDFMGADYQRIRESARDVFMTEEAVDLYCEIYNFNEKGEVVIVYTLEDIYSCYPTGETVEDYKEIIEDGEIKHIHSSTSQGDFIYILKPMKDASGKVVGIVEVGSDMTSINQRNKDLLLKLFINVVAMTVVVIMVVLEMISYLNGQRKYRKHLSKGGDPKEIPSEIYRVVVFMVFFFTNLTAAIMPIYAVKISKDISFANLSPELLAAIPISAEVFSGAVFSAIGGSIIRKLGVKRSVTFSSLLFSGSLLLRAIPNIWVLSLSSILLGMGWGIELLLVNVFIASLPEEEKDKGYALENIASLTGCNSAVVLGGFIIQWVNYKILFLITGFISFALFFISNRYLTNLDYIEEEQDEASGKKLNPVTFIFKPKVIIYFVFMLTPLLICGYFLYYMYPILGDKWGISETHIGYSYIITGLLSVILGSKLTEVFSKKNMKGLGLFISAVLYAEAFLNIALNQSVSSLIVALMLIGIADSFGIPLLSAYFTDLKEVEDYGYDRSMGIYSLFENGAQSIGSFVFGAILVAGIKKGFMILLLVLVACSFIFLVTSRILTGKDSIDKKVVDNEKETK